ncbi:MAG: Rps23 Pro-64 3,4-dihydroxylase Tpa1-like proline 4-hydroxylase [Flavobacteriaceae bacterium]|jgi:Rps23 Pro-64 3,4-dihydroxylase Tpa1-like proline 4-hydroxylase
MKYISITSLEERFNDLKADYQSKEPYRYIVFDDFFPPEIAEQILNEYPAIKNGKWDGTTYLDQKNKFQKSSFDKGSIMDDLFNELNSDIFLSWLQKLSEVEEDLMGDEDLMGGGLHQSVKGAFLNVHVDYNINPKTKFHRRLNVLIYMNKDWKDEFEGHLELWDLSDGRKNLLASVAPIFNRCVIFETNEISFHGHPKPLNTPDEINRKSIATYYYTKNRPDNEIAKEHNTLYVNTEGFSGKIKRLSSGVKALLERINKK